MRNTKAALCAILFILLQIVIYVFGIARYISSRALQAVLAGLIAALLWFGFIRKINKNRKERSE